MNQFKIEEEYLKMQEGVLSSEQYNELQSESAFYFRRGNELLEKNAKKRPLMDRAFNILGRCMYIPSVLYLAFMTHLPESFWPDFDTLSLLVGTSIGLGLLDISAIMMRVSGRNHTAHLANNFFIKGLVNQQIMANSFVAMLSTIALKQVEGQEEQQVGEQEDDSRDAEEG